MRLIEYARIFWSNNNPPPVNAQNLNKKDVALFQIGEVLDNPDVDPTRVPLPANVAGAQIEEILSWFANRLAALSGEANWYDAPDTTLAGALLHANASNPHPGSVGFSRAISTVAPLGGGGSLASDRTLTVDTATEAARGVVEMADGPEAAAGTAADRAMSPLRTRELLDQKANLLELPLKITRAASTSNVNIAAGGTGVVAGMDTGVSLNPGDRVLLKNQTSTPENGLYIVSSAGAWTRSIQADTGLKFRAGTLIVVTEGATYADQIWELTTNDPITIGTTGLSFAVQGGSGGGGADASSSQKGITFLDRDPTVGNQPRAIGQNSLIFETHIEGLSLVWDGLNALSVLPGSAWMPGLGRVLNVPAAISKTALVFAASTWYYVYLFDNAGVPDIEITTVAPAAPYKGSARVRSGGTAADLARRYLGAVRSNAAAAPGLFNFRHNGEFYRWLETTYNAPFAVSIQSNTTSTVNANISAAAVVPPTSTLALLRSFQNGTVTYGIPGLATDLRQLSATDTIIPIELSDTQLFRYRMASGGLHSQVLGFYEDR